MAKGATALVALAVCVVLATLVVVRTNDQQMRVATQNRTDAVIGSIDERLNVYKEILYGVRFFFEQDGTSREAYHDLIERLDVSSRHPGVQVIGAAHVVDATEISAHTRGVNDEVDSSWLPYPDFEIYPPSAGHDVLAIDFIEPQVGNERGFGLDFFSEPNRRTAAERARDSGRPSATAPITLVQEQGEQSAFLLMLPLYERGTDVSTLAGRRAAFTGVVYAAFRMDDLVAGILGPESSSELVVGDVGSGELMYGDPEGALVGLAGSDEHVGSIEQFGRTWRIVVDDPTTQITNVERRRPFIIPVVGLLVAGLIIALVRSMRSTHKRAMALAAEMTEELEALTEATSEAIVSVDESGTVVGWNTGATRIFGLESEEILGRNVDLLVPAADRPDFNESFLANFDATADASGPDRTFRLDGRRGDHDFPAEMTVSQWSVRGQTVWTAFIRDITDRVEADRSLRETSELLTSVVGAATEMSLIATDNDGLISVFNAGAERLLGYSASQVVGVATAAMLHDPDEIAARAIELGIDPTHDVFTTRTQEGHPETRTWTLIRSDGARVPVELTVSPRYDVDGHLRGSIGVAVDITARLAAQAEQQRLLDQQRQIVTRLTEIDRVKNDFVSTMSHELRTPLTSIIGYTELLSCAMGATAPRVEAGMVTMIERNALRLLVLVEDILALSQIESGAFRIRRQSCDPAQILRAACDTVVPLAANRDVSIHLDVDTLPSIQGDARQLERVFLNLLSNAVKFSNDGGRVVVRADVGDSLRVSVADDGIGIPADEQSQLFRRFFRSRNADEHAIQGTGLGLAIVSSIVDRHRGQIHVESQEGIGTTVTVLLPLTKHHLARRHQRASHRRGGVRMSRILVVEDDDDICELIRFQLSSMGHHVLTERDGEGGLAAARLEHPDLVVLDWMMPRLTGLEVCVGLRGDPDLARVPVILLTARAQEADIELGFAAGADDYMIKPFSPRELGSRVDALLGLVER